MAGVCHTCFQIIINIDLRSSTDQDVLKKLKACFPQLVESLVIDPIMCNSCYSSLENAYQFKSKCLQTQNQIINLVKENLSRESIEDARVVLKPAESNCGCSVDVICLPKMVKHDDIQSKIGVKHEDEDSCKIEDVAYDICKIEHDIEIVAAPNDVATYVPSKLYTKPVLKKQKNKKRGKVRQPVTCDLCPSVFPNRLKFGRHLKTHENMPYHCPVCPFRTSVKSRLKIHTRVHTREHPFKCTDCEYSTSQCHRLKTHMKIHTGDRPFSCYECGNNYTRKRSLINHMITHTGEKSYICDRCGYRANLECTLRSHILTHSNVKPNSCEICHKKFSKRSNLTRHMRIHSGERPFVCDQCGACFRQNHNLHSHARIHTGNKPFKCRECDYGTVERSALKRHIRIHTGERPFACSKCDYRASQSGSIKLHMKVHRKQPTVGGKVEALVGD